MAIDYTAIFGVEEYDPCAALVELRPQYMKAVVTGGVDRIKFRDRDVQYGTTALKEFAALIEQLESDCNAKQGRPARRMAITAGTRYPG